MPKQFLRLSGDATLLQETYRRALRLAPPERVFVVAPVAYRDLILSQLPGLDPASLILEPEGRDTAAAIGLAAVHLERTCPGAVMVVLPADHIIADDAAFAATLRAAASWAAAGEWLVTVGIRPTRPETGYGYIRLGEQVAGGPSPAFRVARFTEKPPYERAVEFLAAGDHLWNSGMFAWRVGVLRAIMARHLPELHAALERIASAIGTPRAAEAVRREYGSLPRVSIDFGLLEKAEDVLVLPGAFGWDDVGSWPALERVMPADAGGNVSRGKVVSVGASRSILYNALEGKLLVAYGVEGLLVVDTDDVLLVADKALSANLKAVVEELRRRGLERYLDRPAPGDVPAAGVPREEDWPPVAGRVVSAAADAGPSPDVRVQDKPWGREVWWAVTDRYAGKIIEVRAGHSLSLQYHVRKMETLLFARGTGRMVMGDRAFAVAAGLCVTVPPGTVHRVTAETDLVFYEVSTPELDDVVRLEDDYGRAAGSH